MTMNMYQALGDAAATFDGRDLAARLVSWHDSMVMHLRAISFRGVACDEGCPHEQARLLWAEAMDVFGRKAKRLAFLRTHGDMSTPSGADVPLEARL